MTVTARKQGLGYRAAWWRDEAGFTLSELLIAILLSSFLLNALFSLYLESARVYRLQRAYSALQSNASRIAYLFKQINYQNFRVKKTNRHYRDGAPIYSLYLLEHQREKEMVEGVNRLQIYLDVMEIKHLIRKRPEDINVADKVVGVLVALELTAPPLTVKWYTYAALK